MATYRQNASYDFISKKPWDPATAEVIDDEDEAEFIALVGEDVARRIAREQPENYPIMVSHWCFMKSDVIREND